MKKVFIITGILLLCFSGIILAAGNEAEITQNGEEQTARVRQDGSDNEVYIVQGVEQAESNRAYVYQNGNDNTADTLQLGNSNLIDIFQYGDGNLADISQTGINNECALEQINDNNVFQCAQIGSRNLVKGLAGDSESTLDFDEEEPAVQFDGASFSCTQFGSDNVIGLYQGNGYSANIEQYFDNNQALLYQTGGSDHFVEIVQIAGTINSPTVEVYK